jgi:hypothetical protein
MLKGRHSPPDTDMPMMPVMNMTIHRQVLKLLEEAGREGLTLNVRKLTLVYFNRFD